MPGFIAWQCVRWEGERGVVVCGGAARSRGGKARTDILPVFFRTLSRLAPNLPSNPLRICAALDNNFGCHVHSRAVRRLLAYICIKREMPVRKNRKGASTEVLITTDTQRVRSLVSSWGVRSDQRTLSFACFCSACGGAWFVAHASGGRGRATLRLLHLNTSTRVRAATRPRGAANGNLDLTPSFLEQSFTCHHCCHRRLDDG